MTLDLGSVPKNVEELIQRKIESIKWGRTGEDEIALRTSGFMEKT